MKSLIIRNYALNEIERFKIVHEPMFVKSSISLHWFLFIVSFSVLTISHLIRDTLFIPFTIVTGKIFRNTLYDLIRIISDRDPWVIKMANAPVENLRFKSIIKATHEQLWIRCKKVWKRKDVSLNNWWIFEVNEI